MKMETNQSNGWIIKGGIIVFIIILIVFAIKPKAMSFQVESYAWETQIDIEKYQLVKDSGWELPRDYEELLYTSEEIYDYEKIVDHYETHYSKDSDGNETRTEEPVYRERPIYRTKYYYTIWEWRHDRYSKAEGTGRELQYNHPTLGENEREGNIKDTYYVIGNVLNNEKYDQNPYKFQMTNKTEWLNLEKGKVYIVKTGLINKNVISFEKEKTDKNHRL